MIGSRFMLSRMFINLRDFKGTLVLSKTVYQPTCKQIKPYKETIEIISRGALRRNRE